jgi:CheY-like chemotaxis protein
LEYQYIRSWWDFSFTNSPFAAFVLHSNLTVIDQNEASEGQNLESLLTPASFRDMIQLITVGINVQASVQVEMHDQGKMDMEIFCLHGHWLVRLKPIEDRSTLIDTLNRKAQIGDIIAEVTHGISNPLAIIQGRIELMKAKYTHDKKLSKQLDTVFSQCSRLFSLLQALQSIIFSHMPQNKTIEIPPIIEQVKSNIANRFFRIEFVPQIDTRLFSDEKVLLVLIERFCYFLLRINEQKLSLRLSLKESNLLSFEMISGHIEDTNISFMKEALTEKTQGSLGFDLMLASILMKDLGIKIVDLERNGFALQFQENPNLSNIPIPKTCLKIAVVDDNRFLRTTLQSLLSHDGHLIQSFETAEQAWEAVISNSFDAIILDYNLPQMNGEDMWRLLKRDYPKIANRIILTTGGSYVHPPEACFLPKPFTKHQLLEAIESVQ